MPIEIRAARRDELPAVYGVLDSAFDGPLQLFIDQTEGDSTLRMRHVRVATVDGRIMAHVRIFQRRMLVRGVPVAAGGIGSVAAHPDARGLGLPTALLNDALAVMQRDGTPLSFLFTGIPAFYERLGWRITPQPQLHVDAAEAAAMPHLGDYVVRRITGADVPALLSIYRRATSGRTGAIVRKPRIWRDAQAWLGEDPAGCLVASWAGRPVAYVRSAARHYGYDVIDAAHLPGHDGAIAALLARASRRAAARQLPFMTTAPDDSAVALRFRALASVSEAPHATHPMMMRVVGLRPLLEALLPQLRDAAGRHRGEPFSLGFASPDGETATLAVEAAAARITRAAPMLRFDADASLAVLLGGSRASAVVRPRPPAGIARRIDALLPEVAMHFWNADRI